MTCQRKQSNVDVKNNNRHSAVNMDSLLLLDYQQFLTKKKLRQLTPTDLADYHLFSEGSKYLPNDLIHQLLEIDTALIEKLYFSFIADEGDFWLSGFYTIDSFMVRDILTIHQKDSFKLVDKLFIDREGSREHDYFVLGKYTFIQDTLMVKFVAPTIAETPAAIRSMRNPLHTQKYQLTEKGFIRIKK